MDEHSECSDAFCFINTRRKKNKTKKPNKKSTPVWGQTGSSQTCTWHMLQSLLCKYHMRCSGKKLPNWESPLNFPVTFPALCCTLIPKTCANKQEEMREVPFLLYQGSLKLGNPPKAVNNKYIVLRQPKIMYLKIIHSVHQAPWQTIQTFPLPAATFCSSLLHLLAPSKCKRSQTAQGNCQAMVSKTYMNLIKDF